MAKNTEKKGALGMFENMSNVARKEPEKKITNESANSKATKPTIVKEQGEKAQNAAVIENKIKENTTETIKSASVEIINPTQSNEKIVEKKSTEQKKTSGRPNTRGKKGKDFQLINIAVPNDVYNKLRELSYEKAAGNMTFYINKLLKEAIEKEK